MHRAVGVLVCTLALVSCKKPRSDNAEVVTAFEGFATRMCACADRACADLVLEAMTAWSTEMAKKPDDGNRPDEAAMKAMTDLGQKYSDCLTKLMDLPVPVKPTEPPEPTEPAEPTEPTPTVTVSRPADRPTIAKLVQEAKDYHRAAEEHLALHVLTARYVASDGMLDPTYGELTIGFGNRPPTPPGPALDDPARPTGAPIPDPPAPRADTWGKRDDHSLCPTGTWTSKSGWTWKSRGRFCTTAPEIIPRCSTAEVWNRAKAKRAPATAIAVLDLLPRDDGTQSWSFSITDELRKVDIDLVIKDNCTAVVEKQ